MMQGALTRKTWNGSSGMVGATKPEATWPTTLIFMAWKPSAYDAVRETTTTISTTGRCRRAVTFFSRSFGVDGESDGDKSSKKGNDNMKE